MITAIDSNILIDLGVEDSSRATDAAKALEECASAGRLVVCEIALAEFARGLSSDVDPAGWVHGLGILYDSIQEETAVAAGRLQARHEERAGRGRRLIGDFLIGAHALHQADRLLTRDRGFYRDYFRGLKLVEPR